MSSRNDGRRARSGAPRAKEAQGLGAVLDGLLQERPWRAGVAVGELARRWSDVVGERLAEECTPAGLEGGVLTVKASSAAWAAQVGFLATEIGRRANEVVREPLVASVRVLVDPDRARSPGPRGGSVGGGR